MALLTDIVCSSISTFRHHRNTGWHGRYLGIKLDLWWSKNFSKKVPIHECNIQHSTTIFQQRSLHVFMLDTFRVMEIVQTGVFRKLYLIHTSRDKCHLNILHSEAAAHKVKFEDIYLILLVSTSAILVASTVLLLEIVAAKYGRVLSLHFLTKFKQFPFNSQ